MSKKNDIIPVIQSSGQDVTVVLLADTADAGQITICLESILNQQTKLRYEIVILFFRQPDNAADLCQEYAAVYPGKVRFYISLKERSDLEYICIRSPYIILSNGVEQWIDRKKLQKQYDFLRKNKSYALCFHNIRYSGSEAEPATNTTVNMHNDRRDRIDLNHLLKYYSALFRTRTYKSKYSFPLIKKDGYNLFTRQIGNGRIKCLPPVMSLITNLTEKEKEKIDLISPSRKWHYYL